MKPRQPRMSENRRTLRRQYKAHAKAVIALKKKMLKLAERDFKMSDKLMQYREEQVTRGRGNNKTTQFEGRCYWKQWFEDEDDPKNGVWVERSFLVSVNGKMEDLRGVVERDTRVPAIVKK